MDRPTASRRGRGEVGAKRVLSAGEDKGGNWLGRRGASDPCLILGNRLFSPVLLLHHDERSQKLDQFCTRPRRWLGSPDKRRRRDFEPPFDLTVEPTNLPILSPFLTGGGGELEAVPGSAQELTRLSSSTGVGGVIGGLEEVMEQLLVVLPCAPRTYALLEGVPDWRRRCSRSPLVASYIC
jgi:hypothetical protein